jgi:WD40 repeat protein
VELLAEEAKRWRSFHAMPVVGENLSAAVANLIERLAKQHGRQLVAYTVRTMVAARHGTTETEILALLASDPAILREVGETSPRSPVTDRLPFVVWARLLGELDPYLTPMTAINDALMNFFHQQIGQAVRDVCLSEDDVLTATRSLAAYFSAQPTVLDRDKGIANARKLAELPYLLARSQQFDAFSRLLTAYEFIAVKAAASGVQAVLDDFDLVPTATRGCHGAHIIEGVHRLAYLQANLRQGQHTVDRDPAQLPSQLFGRLSRSEAHGLGPLLEMARLAPTGPWLRPLRPSLAPGDAVALRTVPVRLDVSALCVTPHGKWVVAAGCGTAIWSKGAEFLVLDARHGTPLASYRTRSEVDAVCALPDNWRILSAEHFQSTLGAAARPSELHLRNIMTGEILRTFDGHSGVVEWLATSADGRFAASAARSIADAHLARDDTVRIWEVDTGAVRHVLDHETPISSMAFSADGRVVVSTSVQCVKVWDAVQGRLLATFDLQPGDRPPNQQHPTIGRENIVLLPGGSTALSTASYPSRLTLWNVGTGKVIAASEGPYARAIAVTSDGTRAFVAGSALIEWDVDPLGPTIRLDTRNTNVRCLAVSPHGEVLFTGSDSVQFWPIRKQDVTRRSRPPDAPDRSEDIHRIVVSPAGDLAISASYAGEFVVWDLATGARRRSQCCPNGGRAMLALMPDGLTALSSSGPRLGDLEGFHLALWDIESGTILRRFGAPDARAITALAVSGDSRVAATGHERVNANATPTVRAWDIEYGRQKWFTPVTGAEDVALADTVVAIGYQGGHILDLGTGREQRSIITAGTLAAITPDGRWIVTAAHDSGRSLPPEAIAYGAYYEVGVHFWSVADGREMHSGSAEIYDNAAGVRALLMSRSQGLAVVGCDDGAVRLWDVASGRLRRVLRHDAAVNSVGLSSADRWLASCSNDGPFYVWDLSTGERIATFLGDTAFRTCAATADWSTFVVAEAGGGFHILRFEHPVPGGADVVVRKDPRLSRITAGTQQRPAQ